MLVNDFTLGFDRGWKEGFEAGKAYGRLSAGQPSLAENQCPGGGQKPKEGLSKLKSSGHPGRGHCPVCGVDFKLTWSGRVRKHRSKLS